MASRKNKQARRLTPSFCQMLSRAESMARETSTLDGIRPPNERSSRFHRVRWLRSYPAQLLAAHRESYHKPTELRYTLPESRANSSLTFHRGALDQPPGFRVLWGSLSGRGTNQGRDRRPPRGTRPKPHRYENRVRTREGRL